ncbi:MAG: hypothetical protein D6753_13715 [Planctomycetota bacterium]|nr:MAG: hypothetical protein D6753_13715 [Planctomycetota bacterium]
MASVRNQLKVVGGWVAWMVWGAMLASSGLGQAELQPPSNQLRQVPGSATEASAAQGDSASVPAGQASPSTEVAGAPPAAVVGTISPADADALSKTITARLEQLQAAEGIAQETKDALAKLYQQALSDLERARGMAEKTAAFRQRIDAAPQLIEKAKREKEQRTAGGSAPAGPDLSELTFEDLQALQRQVESDLAAATAQKTQLSAEVNRRAARRKELPQLISDMKAKVEQASTATPENGAARSEDPLMQEAQTWANTARLHAMAAELAMLESEMRAYDAEAQLLPLQIEAAEATERSLQQRLKAIADELTQRRKNRIISYRIDFSHLNPPSTPPFDRIRQWLGLDVPSEQRLSDMVSGTRVTWQSIAESDATLQAAMAAYQQNLERWRERQAKMKLRVEGQDESLGRFNTWVGLMLRKQRAELPDPLEIAEKLRGYQQQINAADSLLFDIEDAFNELRQLRERVQESADSEQLQLLALTEEILTAMRNDVNNYLTDLYQIADLLEQTAQFSNEYRRFIDEHVLWIRSTGVLSRDDILPGVEAFRWLVQLEHWRQAGQALWTDLRQRWWWYALFLGGWGSLLAYGTRLRRKLADLSQRAAKGSCTAFGLTMESTLLTALLSLPLPLLLVFVAWRFRVAADVAGVSDVAVEFLRAWAAGMEKGAIAVAPLELLRQVCRANGLGIKHFGWSENIAGLVKHNLRWLIDLGLPLIVVIEVLRATEDTAWEASLGRVCFLGLMVVLSMFLYRVFSPQRGVLSNHLVRHPDGWLNRLRYGWFTIIVGSPLLLALVSAAGYHYTAQRIAGHLSATMWMVVGLLVVYHLLNRWLLLGRRRLMIAQAKARLKEAAERESSEGLPVKPVEADEVNLIQVNEQTRRLVFSFSITIGLIGAYYIWSDVLPAIGLLDRFELWEVQGATPDQTVSITLAHLVLVIPIVALVVIAARNIPGLLEIFLQHLPLTKAAKYAITTLVRYCIVAIGIVVAGGTIGLRWSSVQWLVAALGVGLGFGLQEIFANFVSGLILLFEQPIRVGDVVTVDGVTGTVSRIRIRATTIVNWDRQELIVPNKDMITGKLLNWTLSDTTNRIVINFGVAYGCDIARACEVIARVCDEHENLLKDPPPVVTFEGFGDSSLNIVVRAYLQNLDHRLKTIHEMHQRIYVALAENGIEIPFPQRDLHIRSLAAPLVDLVRPADRSGEGR